MDSLIGITQRDWLRLLKDNKYTIDFPYWHRALLLSIRSRMNSNLAKKEQQKWAAEIEGIRLVDDPIFIMGHWRSGTTLLHNYFALDQQFAYPNLLEISNPHTFFELEKMIPKELKKEQDTKRPMDNVNINHNSPGEDAFALLIMSLVSPLLGWSFPRRAEFYDKYLTLDDVQDEELDRWRQSFLFFVKKLTLKYNRQLVLKSPSHTAVIKNILEIFPNAKFIHIHRNPYKVFLSTLKLYNTAIEKSQFQRQAKNVADRIIKQYDLLYSAYLRDLNLIPSGRHIEVSYSELAKSPMRTVEHIYNKLEISGFETARVAFQEKVDADRDYKKNEFSKIAPEISAKIQQKWEPYFRRWGYPLSNDHV